MTTSYAIHAHHVTKRFADAVALSDFELDVTAGSIMTLLGPSGCGKTTGLRLIAGFDRPDSGSISMGDRVVVDDTTFLPPEKRRIGMVFQDYALFPHMTVAANVAYGLERSNRTRIEPVLELVGLSGLGDRMPHELSGGEQQRVALARALAPEPGVILLDEPFSNLDASLRDRMRRDVRTILSAADTTAIFVTHDQEEALAIADVVAVMQDGQVVQTGTPQNIYRSPVSPWVAGFVGESEFFDGVAQIGKVVTDVGTFPQFGPHRGPVTVMIRPEWIHPSPSADGTALVTDCEFYGHDQLLTIELPGGRLVTSRIGTNAVVEPGDHVDLGIDQVVLFPARS